MRRLENRVVMITGAGQGLGSGIARRLASEGSAVALLDIDLEKAQAVADEINAAGGSAMAAKCNVVDAAQIQETVAAVKAKFGKVDGLVNVVGVSNEARNRLWITDLTEEQWDFLIDINLKSVFFMTKYTLPEMLEAGGGSIVNISSMAAFEPNFGAAYGAAKAAVVAFTKSTAVQYADDNIRANVIAPGAMDTPGGVSVSGKGIFKGHNLRRNRMIQSRAGKPEDIAAAAAYLLSDEAGFITGNTLCIDGGMLALLTDIPKRVPEEE